MSNYLKIEITILNNIEVSCLLKIENCFKFSKHIKLATKILMNVLQEPNSVNLCLEYILSN